MSLKKTPLYERHLALGARLVEFAGFEMPVQYDSLIKEHLAVREGCGLFDVSHMGEIEISGPGARSAVQSLTTNDAASLDWGESQYTLLCYPDGGVVDDVILYCHGPERFIFCVNASNTAKVLEWFSSHRHDGVTIRDLSDETALIALQGPLSRKVLSEVTEIDLSVISRFFFIRGEVCGAEAIISRTGYTGEDGYEFYIDPKDALKLWDGLMRAGRASGITPVGLGARDTLRLEMGYPLYGFELSKTLTPLEAGLKRFVRLDGDDFIGREALVKQAAAGPEKTLAAFEMTGTGIPRSHYPILKNGETVGEVTSGSHSPALKRSIGLGFIRPELNKAGTEIDIEIRGKAVKAVITKAPFYKKKKKPNPVTDIFPRERREMI